MRAWLPVAIYAAVIFTLSSIPGDDLGDPALARYDKLVHGVLYFGLAALIARALRLRCRTGLAVTVAITAAAAFLFGVSDELHQTLVPGRDSSVGDLIADAVGAVAGAWLAAVLYRPPQGAS